MRKLLVGYRSGRPQSARTEKPSTYSCSWLIGSEVMEKAGNQRILWAPPAARFEATKVGNSKIRTKGNELCLLGHARTKGGVYQ